MISVIIPTKNRREILFQCVGFLLDQYDIFSEHEFPLELIVINDGEESLNDLIKKFPTIKVYQNKGNGVASARNYGASMAKNDTLFFMDDDMMIGRDAFEYAISFHAQHQNAVLNFNWVYPEHIDKELDSTAFGRYLRFFQFTSLKGMHKNTGVWSDDELFKVAHITSQNLSLSKDTFNQLDGYDESFPFAGFEDTDFANRMKEKSISMYINPVIMTFHNESDRLQLKNWLDRKYRGGVTRKVAALKGIDSASLHYPFYKIFIFYLLMKIETPILQLLNSRTLNRQGIWDALSFRLINLLLALNIYKGYTENSILT